MRRRPLAKALFLSLALLVAACGTSAAPASPRTEGAERPSSAPKTLTFAISGEPGDLGTLMEGGGISPDGIREMVQNHLGVYDDSGQIQPQLAISLPTEADGSWIVRPDGTMLTTYHLRPAVTWHDGTPLSAQDFIFALQVNQDLGLPIHNALVAPLIARIDAPDPLTLNIEWTTTYPFANAITTEDLGPLPAHLIASDYATNHAQFADLPYWRAEFVGVGPYQMSHWELGSYLTITAYDHYYGGRPKIDTITYRFIPSAQTIAANLLSGAIDGTTLDALDFNSILAVQQQWELAGLKPSVVSLPRHWRYVGVQFRPETVAPAELLDPRLRQALLRGIDRQAMVDALFNGQVPTSDTMFPPSDRRWGLVQDVVTKYPYDPQGAQQLLAAIGWRQGADGVYANASGERATIPLWGTADELTVHDMAIVADDWKQLGLSIDQTVLPSAQQRDRHLRSTFPAVEITSTPLAFVNLSVRFQSSNCPAEANQWSGDNRGCYTNPAIDRAVQGLLGAIEPAYQRAYYRDFVRLTTQELPVLPLYFKITASIIRDGVSGPKATATDTTLGWNIVDWDLRS